MELLLVSHQGIATGMKSAVSMVLGDAANQISTLELTQEEGITQFSERLEQFVTEWLKDGKRGLIFADLRGGTPYNQSELILEKHGLKTQAKVISGMNLPMIVEALLREIDVCDASELESVVFAAREGIVCSDLMANAADSDDE